MFKVNPALCSLLGYSREELETKHLIDVTHREDRAASRESVRCLLAGDKASDRLAKRYLHKDGRTVWGDVSTILLRNRDGSPRCFITHVLDISDHKRFEAALRKSEAQLSSALQMARAGHWEYDVAGDMFTFNDNFYRIFRTTAAEVGGYEMSSAEYAGRFCHPDDAGLVAQEVRAAIETTDPSHRRQLEHRVLFADGEIGHIAVRFSVIKDAQGRTVSTFGVNQDITERMRFQAQIAQSDRLASMGMLAAGVAHEINNPLSYVLYNLASLDDDLPRIAAAWKRCVSEATDRLGRGAWVALLGSDRDLLAPAMLDDVLERFNDALHGTRRIKDIARGLATFSRVEQDRLVQVDLSEVIEAAIDMVFNEIKYRARLVKEYGKVATIAANDGRLSQVFLNLLINATHAIEEGDQEGNEIRVRTWQQGDEVFAEVRDTGSGIAPKDLPHLFEPFFTTKAIGVGTGLGLSISKNIVESYRGRIEVTSTLGKGTSFVVRLPVSSSTASTGPRAAASPRMASPAHPGAGGRILIVDDEPGIRAAMVRMLLGNQVVEACSGEEARKILEGDQAFDVILCDMMMPTMSGVDLHEWILQEHPALADQLVFITGGAFTPKARDHLAAVSNVRLEKPFDVDTLRQVVAKMILAARPPG
jgi:PAS domain S-box-containing protein